MKRLLLAFSLLIGLSASALAPTPAAASCGVNFVPVVGVICDLVRNPTYTATSIGLVPASSATDIFCISPGATKTIALRRLTIGGVAGTAITTPFLLYERSALGTSGTAATGLAAPVPVPLLPSDPASTATLIAYTANPTVAATPLLMDALLVDLPVTTAAGGTSAVTKQWGSSVDFFDKGIDLTKASTLQLCVNLNGVSVSSGVLAITAEWQEN